MSRWTIAGRSRREHAPGWCTANHCGIDSYLHPLGILQLSRTSLEICATLVSKNTANHIWITARWMIGIPECPPNLSEPQYAALVFEHTCFVSNYVSQLLDLLPLIIGLWRQPSDEVQFSTQGR